MNFGYSDSFWSQKGPSHTENHQILRQSATVTLLPIPTSVTVTKVLCNNFATEEGLRGDDGPSKLGLCSESFRFADRVSLRRHVHDARMRQEVGENDNWASIQ